MRTCVPLRVTAANRHLAGRCASPDRKMRQCRKSSSCRALCVSAAKRHLAGRCASPGRKMRQCRKTSPASAEKRHRQLKSKRHSRPSGIRRSAPKRHSRPSGTRDQAAFAAPRPSGIRVLRASPPSGTREAPGPSSQRNPLARLRVGAPAPGQLVAARGRLVSRAVAFRSFCFAILRRPLVSRCFRALPDHSWPPFALVPLCMLYLSASRSGS